MASIDFDPEDYLDEVSTRYLEAELERRSDKNTKQPKKYNGELKEWEMKEITEQLRITNLSDVLKFEHFMKKFRNIPESEIDNFLNRYY